MRGARSVLEGRVRDVLRVVGRRDQPSPVSSKLDVGQVCLSSKPRDRHRQAPDAVDFAARSCRRRSCCRPRCRTHSPADNDAPHASSVSDRPGTHSDSTPAHAPFPLAARNPGMPPNTAADSGAHPRAQSPRPADHRRKRTQSPRVLPPPPQRTWPKNLWSNLAFCQPPYSSSHIESKPGLAQRQPFAPVCRDPVGGMRHGHDMSHIPRDPGLPLTTKRRKYEPRTLQLPCPRPTQWLPDKQDPSGQAIDKQARCTAPWGDRSVHGATPRTT